MASAAVVGVTVRHVITRSTGAAGSPQIRPTLSQGSASREGAKSLEPARHVANGRHDVLPRGGFGVEFQAVVERLSL